MDNEFSCFAVDKEKAIRDIPEADDDNGRSCFCRDRDRILYSKEFRRLSGKTQVFVSGFDDHCRTRLTHTLEVVQIATSISKRLGLNVELTEAIAYGHDVGHTPFGHVGERFLNLVMNGCYDIKKFNENLPLIEKGFKHNWQGVRVVSELEKYLPALEKNGINLTDYTKWGILHHTSTTCKKCKFLITREANDKLEFLCGYLNSNKVCTNLGDLSLDFYSKYNESISHSWSFEAFVVALSDEIAQRHHDLEDGLEANIIDKQITLDVFNKIFKIYLKPEDVRLLIDITKTKDKQYTIHLFGKLIVNFLINNLIVATTNNFIKLKSSINVNTNEEFYKIKKDLDINDMVEIVSYNFDFKIAEEELQKYLYGYIINSHLAQKMDGKASYILRQLMKAFVTNPQQLPDKTIKTIFVNFEERIKNKKNIKNILKKYDVNIKDLYKVNTGDLRKTLSKLHLSDIMEYKYSLLRTLCDYISGMTDQFAIEQYESLYESKSVHTIF